jgi:hypothetical protein
LGYSVAETHSQHLAHIDAHLSVHDADQDHLAFRAKRLDARIYDWNNASCIERGNRTLWDYVLYRSR